MKSIEINIKTRKSFDRQMTWLTQRYADREYRDQSEYQYSMCLISINIEIDSYLLAFTQTTGINVSPATEHLINRFHWILWSKQQIWWSLEL